MIGTDEALQILYNTIYIRKYNLTQKISDIDTVNTINGSRIFFWKAKSSTSMFYLEVYI